MKVPDGIPSKGNVLEGFKFRNKSSRFQEVQGSKEGFQAKLKVFEGSEVPSRFQAEVPRGSQVPRKGSK